MLDRDEHASMTAHAERLDRLAAARAAIEAAEPPGARLSPAEGAPPRDRLDGEARLALQRAVMLLSVRGLPAEELRRRLARRYAPEAVEAALRALAGSPFLDDRAWASAYVAGMRGRERSGALLRRELRAKGVSVADAAAALEGHDDREAALAAARKRIRSLARLEPAVRTRRLRDYLLRRGFGASAVRAAIEAADAAFPSSD
jgi:regulatory protein